MLGVSRGFAFARFLSLPESKQFMDTHYPAIDLGERCPRVRLAYSKERDENAVGADDWTCRMVCKPRQLRNKVFADPLSVCCQITLDERLAFGAELQGVMDLLVPLPKFHLLHFQMMARKTPAILLHNSCYFGTLTQRAQRKSCLRVL